MSAPASVKVAICIPSGSEWKADFALSLLYMKEQAAKDGIEAIILNARGSILPRSRHDLVRLALARGSTHVLFLDCDMSFPMNTLTRLLAHGQAVVGAICPMRRLHPESNCMASVHSDARTAPAQGGLTEVGAIGTAILLIEARVFQKLPTPWFMFGFSAAHDSYCGEDTWLCTRIREVTGESIFADLSFSYEVAHVGDHAFVFDGADPDLVTRTTAALKRPGT